MNPLEPAAGHVAATSTPTDRSTPGDPAETEASSCWSGIGVVGGDGSCRELAIYIHCRNCPVYSSAGVKLLDRPIPESYRVEWTKHYADTKGRTPLGRLSLLIFRVGGEWLALPSVVFQEVTERRPVHSVPHRRQSIVLGLVNIRGELLICVSLARLLGLAAAALQPRTPRDRLLVVNHAGKRLAFPVDEVHGTRRVHVEELQEPPATVIGAGETYTRGVLNWQNRSVGCLDAERLLAAFNRNFA